MAEEPPKDFRKELFRSKSGLRMVSVNESIVSPFLLDEPSWTADEEVSMCQKCGKTFDFFNRRHHCRRCGKIFCDKDTRRKLPLPRMSFIDPVRLCGPCATETSKENEFFDKHIKTLVAGGQFDVASSFFDQPEEPKSCLCKLSKSHKQVEILNKKHFHETIEISKITKVQILMPEDDSVPNGLILKYRDEGETERSVTMKLRGDSSRKQAALWIAAMQKGMKLIFSGKSASDE